MTAPNVVVSAPERVGFLEESRNVKSMTRLAALLLACGVLVLCATIPAVALLRAEQAPAIIGAIAGAIGTLGGGIWGALKVRA